ASSNCALTQLITFLCQLSSAPTDCTFVYDGNDRPAYKRGIQVVKREPFLYRISKIIIEAFGFRVHMAKGDAEAELTLMNQSGVFEAILTKDSDVFPLGAQCVLRVVPNKSTNTKLIVDVYYASKIEQMLHLNTGGLVLYSLLVGNDIDKNGVNNFGTVTALAIAQCGFGDTLIADWKAIRSSCMDQHRYFRDLKQKIGKELRCNAHHRLQSCKPALAKILINSNFPLEIAWKWFLAPPTAWSDSADIPNTLSWVPQSHDIPAIAQFCISHVGWSPETTLERCHQKVWRSVIIRILCSVCLFLLSPSYCYGQHC
ncbi:PIN domain-like protein, partial [Rhodocollybia butyracea]